MINFEKIILHNFGSYGHAEIDLTNRGFCLVSGKNNYKKDNAISNGSGKSFIWSGICFVLTGETIQGLHSNLKNINIEENSCYATLLFSYNGDNYKITRYIEPRSDLKIIKNDVDISGKGIRESEKKLGEILPDLNKDLIASVIILGQGLPNKLSSFSPSERKGLLEKLTKSDFMIEDVKNRVNNRTNEVSNIIRTYDDSLLINKTKFGTAETNLTALSNELASLVKPDFDAQIAAILKQQASIQKDIDKLIEQRKAKEEEIEKINEKLINISKDKGAALTTLLENYQAAIGPVKQEKLTTETTIRNLTTEVNRIKAMKDVCPTCGQKLPNVHKPDTSEQEKQIKTLTESLKPLASKINDIEAKNTQYKIDINNQFAEEEFNTTNSLYKAKKELNKIIDELNDDTQSLNTENGKLSKLTYEKENWDKHYSKIKTAIAETEKSCNELKSAITITEDAKVEMDEHLAILRKMDTLIKRDFRGYLLTNVINYIDLKAKDYCELVFKTRDISIQVDGNALDITYCNKLVDNLSGGEKMRVDLILQLAIRDLLCNYFNFSSNIIVLDEITDYLDKTSCQAVMGLLETVLKDVESVFIISHHADELELAVDSTLQVVKNEDGISSVIC